VFQVKTKLSFFFLKLPNEFAFPEVSIMNETRQPPCLQSTSR